MVIGVLGSFVGAMVGRALGMYREGESAGFLMALAGAVLLTFGYQAIAIVAAAQSCVTELLGRFHLFTYRGKCYLSARPTQVEE